MLGPRSQGIETEKSSRLFLAAMGDAKLLPASLRSIRVCANNCTNPTHEGFFRGLLAWGEAAAVRRAERTGEGLRASRRDAAIAATPALKLDREIRRAPIAAVSGSGRLRGVARRHWQPRRQSQLGITISRKRVVWRLRDLSAGHFPCRRPYDHRRPAARRAQLSPNPRGARERGDPRGAGFPP